MAFTKEQKTKKILKSESSKHTRKPKIAPDPTDINQMENFKDSINTLNTSKNVIIQHLKDYYLHELSNLTPYINAQNRKAARSNGITQWIIITKYEFEIYPHGTMEILIHGKWNNGNEFDENLSDEHFCQKTLDEISEKYKIKINYPYYYFGK